MVLIRDEVELVCVLSPRFYRCLESWFVYCSARENKDVVVICVAVSPLCAFSTPPHHPIVQCFSPSTSPVHDQRQGSVAECMVSKVNIHTYMYQHEYTCM